MITGRRDVIGKCARQLGASSGCNNEWYWGWSQEEKRWNPQSKQRGIYIGCAESQSFRWTGAFLADAATRGMSGVWGFN